VVHSLGPSAAHGRPEPSVKLEHNELVQQLLRLLEIYLTDTRSNQCSHAVCKNPRSDPPTTTTTLHLTKIKSERAIIPSGGDARVSYGTTTSSVGVWILLHSICSASPLQNATAHITQLTSRCAQSNHTERIRGVYLPEVA